MSLMGSNIAKKRISELEGRPVETSHTEVQRKTRKKREQNLEEPWGKFKRCYNYIIGILGEEIEDRAEETLKVIMAENFPKLVKDTKPQIQEAQGTPSRINTTTATTKTPPRHTLLKLQQIKDKEKTLKQAKGGGGNTLLIEEKG